MTEHYYFWIEYVDADGGTLFTETVSTELDHWDLCGVLLSSMPEGAEDFRLEELPDAPKGHLMEPRRLAA